VEERELVEPIAQRLGALGLDVWFDQKVRAGERWDAAIDERLKSARAVIVCWSRRSVQSPWVLWEATYAQQAGVMAPVFLELCTAPGPLSFVQGAQLADWRGQAGHQGWLKLLAEVERLLRRTDLISQEEQRAAAERAGGLIHRSVANFRTQKAKRRKHRILSIDGGGPRAIISLQFLRQIERMLAARSPNPNTFVLADYFDLIGGTSTGAIIAACLAIGMKTDAVDDAFRVIVQNWYGGNLFSRWRKPPQTRLDILNLVGQRRLGSDDFLTGFAACIKRLDTGNIWIVTNNPFVKYWNSTEGMAGNRDMSLVNALVACVGGPATAYAILAEVHDGTYMLCVDGAVGGLIDPSLQLLMAGTLPPFGLNWETGSEKLMLISVGSGHWRPRLSYESLGFMPHQRMTRIVLDNLRSDLLGQNIGLLQALGKSAHPVVINSEVGSMEDCLIPPEPLFTYQRYHTSLASDSLREGLGLEYSEVEANKLRSDFIGPDVQNNLRTIGIAAAERAVREEDFPALFDVHLELAEGSQSVELVN
jgi:hypothetical protein